MVTIDNVEEYIDLVTDFCLNTGIRRQMEALKGQCEVSRSVVFCVLGLFFYYDGVWKVSENVLFTYMPNLAADSRCALFRPVPSGEKTG